MRYAAIDIGSNAVKCMIGSVVESPAGPVVIKEMYARIPVRLGTDVFKSGIISKPVLDRLYDGIKAFCLIIKSWDVDGAIIAATSAMRDAKNGLEVMTEISRISSMKTHIIKGKTEATLVSQLLQNTGPANQQKVIIDLGGGSTEITIINTDGYMLSKSFKVGAVRSLMNAVEPGEMKEMLDFLDKQVSSGAVLIATGGNINALKSIFGLSMPQYLSLLELQNAYDNLSPLSAAERTTQFLVHPDRADVIVPAADVFLRILKHCSSDRLLVPKAGLADALVLMLHQGRVPE